MAFAASHVSAHGPSRMAENRSFVLCLQAMNFCMVQDKTEAPSGSPGFTWGADFDPFLAPGRNNGRRGTSYEAPWLPTDGMFSSRFLSDDYLGIHLSES